MKLFCKMLILILCINKNDDKFYRRIFYLAIKETLAA